MPETKLNTPLPENALYRRHRERIDRIMAKFPLRRSGLMPILWLIQEEDGWISPEMMIQAAELCGCTPAEVLEVASFYQMYHRAPVGKYVLGLCGTLPCALGGADGMYDYLKEKLGIGWGETTLDGLFTIERRECLGACSEAPVMLVDQTLETKLTREKVDAILEECRAGRRAPYFTGRADVVHD
jgi:NADH-quinone oxidoreductase subunit E